MELAKKISEDPFKFIFVNEDDKKEGKIEELKKEYPYEVMRTDPPDTEEGKIVEEFFDLKDGKVQQGYKVVDDVNFYQRKINALEKDLSVDDYKIVKCYEYFLVNKPLPYDIVKLHEERQAKRDEINRLKTIINQLNK